MIAKTISKQRLQLIVITGVLAAVATVLRFLETSIPLIPTFYKLDLSNIPALLGGFALGPIAGTAILFIKNLIYLPFSQTFGVGEIADFVISIALVLPAALIYKYKKNRRGAILGMASGSFLMSFVAGPLMNYFVLVPILAGLMNTTVNDIIQWAAAVNPGIINLWTLIIYAVVPFNIVKCIVICLLTGLLYKPLSPILHKYR